MEPLTIEQLTPQIPFIHWVGYFMLYVSFLCFVAIVWILIRRIGHAMTENMASELYEAMPEKAKRKNSDAEYQYSEDEWYEDEKPKRHGYFEIGDDGELIEVFEDEG